MTTSDGATRLVAEGVTVRRGDELIVDDLSWQHAPGTVAWICGPNGAGKSSLMRVLAGIDVPRAGAVVHEVRGRAADASDIAHYTPSMSLPPEPRAVWFSGMMARLVDGPIPLEPDRALRAKRCASLSTGEEKRLLLGPLLARGRSFIFLDEPYEHLSREARAQLTAALVTLASTSVVVVATNQPIPAEANGPVITLSVREGLHVA